jgi:hypothetical protein
MLHDAKNRSCAPNVLSWVFVTSKPLIARAQIARDKNHHLCDVSSTRLCGPDQRRDTVIVKELIKTPFFNFVMGIAFIFLFFTLPKLFSGLINPVFLMIACLFGFFYFGRKLVHNDKWR